MKSVAIIALTVLAAVYAGPAKRFAGFGGLSGALSTVGGNLGCVVTGNQLFVNGLFEKDLTDEEQQEFSQYETQHAQFKQEIRQLIAERRQQAQNARQNGGENNMISSQSQENNNSSLPQPPPKPSFCNANATTQYIFDGCKVQNNKVYVGNQLARNLTEQEIAQLQTFDEQMTAYQSQLSSSLQAQVKEIFGDQLAALFNGRNGAATSTVAPSSDAATTAAPLEAPEAPNFCTIIY